MTPAERKARERAVAIDAGGKRISVILGPRAVKNLQRARKRLELAGFKPTDTSAIEAALQHYAGVK